MAWQTKKLGDVLAIQNGYAFDSKGFSAEIGTPLIRIRDLKKGTVTETKYKGTYNKRYEVHRGDFLVGMDGEFGCYEWRGEKALLNQRVCRLQDFNGLESRFLFYGINKYLKDIEENTGFTTVKHISSRQIANITFPYPESITEQKRIVKKLDEVFEKITKAKENAEKNLQNAKELFESYLHSVFAKPGKDWEEKKLGDVIKLEYGKPLHQSNRDVGGSYPVYGANGEKSRSKQFYYAKPSIIVGRKGSAGELNLTEKKFWPLDVTYYMTFDEKIYDLKFLYYLLTTQRLTKLAKGVKPGINRNEVYSIVVRMPSLPEQKAIVKKLNELSVETKKLEKIYEQKIADLEELKKSVLQQAFTGKL